MMHMIRLGADVPDLPVSCHLCCSWAWGEPPMPSTSCETATARRDWDRQVAHPPHTHPLLQPLPNKLTSKNVFANLGFQAGISSAPKSTVQDSAKAEHLKSHG